MLSSVSGKSMGDAGAMSDMSDAVGGSLIMDCSSGKGSGDTTGRTDAGVKLVDIL
jgi:hypothetical protein